MILFPTDILSPGKRGNTILGLLHSSDLRGGSFKGAWTTWSEPVTLRSCQTEKNFHNNPFYRASLACNVLKLFCLAHLILIHHVYICPEVKFHLWSSYWWQLTFMKHSFTTENIRTLKKQWIKYCIGGMLPNADSRWQGCSLFDSPRTRFFWQHLMKTTFCLQNLSIYVHRTN
jgi:hypothetical protein